MEIITIYPGTREDARLFKDMAKRLNTHFTAKRVTDTDAEQRKKYILDGISEAVQEIKDYEAGKIKLKTARELYNEL